MNAPIVYFGGKNGMMMALYIAHDNVNETSYIHSIQACLDYINSDELVEITPTTYRMRKKILNTAERKKYDSHVRRGEI